jgi:hypothetical protein
MATDSNASCAANQDHKKILLFYNVYSLKVVLVALLICFLYYSFYVSKLKLLLITGCIRMKDKVFV